MKNWQGESLVKLALAGVSVRIVRDDIAEITGPGRNPAHLVRDVANKETPALLLDRAILAAESLRARGAA